MQVLNVDNLVTDSSLVRNTVMQFHQPVMLNVGNCTCIMTSYCIMVYKLYEIQEEQVAMT